MEQSQPCQRCPTAPVCMLVTMRIVAVNIMAATGKPGVFTLSLAGCVPVIVGSFAEAVGVSIAMRSFRRL